MAAPQMVPLLLLPLPSLPLQLPSWLPSATSSSCSLPPAAILPPHCNLLFHSPVAMKPKGQWTKKPERQNQPFLLTSFVPEAFCHNGRKLTYHQLSPSIGSGPHKGSLPLTGQHWATSHWKRLIAHPPGQCLEQAEPRLPRPSLKPQLSEHPEVTGQVTSG